MEIDLEFYDSLDYYDRYHLAHSGAIYHPMVLLKGISTLIKNGINLMPKLFVLVSYGLRLPKALFESTTPTFYLVPQH
jgi:hypothetical protein